MASSDPPPGGDRDVFSGLPNARPQRRSAKRDRARGAGAKAATAQPAQPAGKSTARSTPGGRAKAGGKAPTKPAARASGKASAKPKAPPIPPAGYATPADDDRPRGTDLVGTAVQAAGELAQIGIAAGGRALKSAIQRLPRP
jgi:hypothetical protein